MFSGKAFRTSQDSFVCTETQTLSARLLKAVCSTGFYLNASLCFIPLNISANLCDDKSQTVPLKYIDTRDSDVTKRHLS